MNKTSPSRGEPLSQAPCLCLHCATSNLVGDQQVIVDKSRVPSTARGDYPTVANKKKSNHGSNSWTVLFIHRHSTPTTKTSVTYTRLLPPCAPLLVLTWGACLVIALGIPFLSGSKPFLSAMRPARVTEKVPVGACVWCARLNHRLVSRKTTAAGSLSKQSQYSVCRVVVLGCGCEFDAGFGSNTSCSTLGAIGVLCARAGAPRETKCCSRMTGPVGR